MPMVDVGGVSLYYELHGPADAPVLALNNGILMNAAASWGHQTPALARTFRVLLHDARGQGQSDHPEGAVTMERHAEDLAALLDALGIGAAHVGGISYGGEVAQAFALAHPDRTRSLILADTVSEVGPTLRRTAEEWMARAAAGDAEGLFRATMAWNFSPEYAASHGPLLEAARERFRKLDLPAVARLCACFLKVDFTARLEGIRAPACILVGERDILKGRTYAEILHRGIRESEMHVLPGAGHVSCWERPQEFNTVVLGFLSKQGGA